MIDRLACEIEHPLTIPDDTFDAVGFTIAHFDMHSDLIAAGRIELCDRAAGAGLSTAVTVASPPIAAGSPSDVSVPLPCG